MTQPFTAEEERKIQQMVEDMKRKEREQRLQDEARWRLLNDHPDPPNKKK